MKNIFLFFLSILFGVVITMHIPLGMEKEIKRIRRTELIQVRMTEQGKMFIKQHFGDQSEFVRAAIIRAAKERGLPVPAL